MVGPLLAGTPLQAAPTSRTVAFVNDLSDFLTCTSPFHPALPHTGRFTVGMLNASVGETRSFATRHALALGLAGVALSQG